MKTTAMYKKCLLLLYAVVLAAALTCGLLAVQAPTAARAEEPAPTTERALYFVDAGYLLKDGALAPRGGAASLCDTATPFMQAYGLTFGDGAGNGLYNSLTDRNLYVCGSGDIYDFTQISKDPKTEKYWGSYCEGKGPYGWEWWRRGKTSSGTPGFESARYINENSSDPYPLVYAFEVDDTTTELKVIVGTRRVTDGNQGEATDGQIQINDLTATKILGKDEDLTYTYSEGIHGVSQTLQSTTEEKPYVTIRFGGNGKITHVSWILVCTKNYELPLTYDLTDFVKKGDTTIQAMPSVGTEAITASFSDESTQAIQQANYFDTVIATVTINGKEYSDTVTVLPESTKYLLNVGSNHDVQGTVRDVAYSAGNGYGYLKSQGSTGWEGDAFDTSCRYNVKNMTYRFDVANGHYGAIVGTIMRWNKREAKITANGGVAVPLTTPTSTDGDKGHATCYGDVTAGQLNVNFTCPEEAILTYILVYEVNKITYDSQGGSEVNGKYFEKGATADVATAKPERDAYEFAGWFAAADGEQEVTTVNANTTVYAHWIACEYDNGSVEWQWNGITSATVVMLCTHANCNQSRTETGTITSEVTETATCTSGGTITYTATVTIGSTPFTDTKTAPGTPLGHLYSEPQKADWTWNSATHAAEVSLTCSRDDCDHSVTKTAEISSSSTGATCTEGGTVTYTATVQVSETNQTFTDTETEQGTPNGHAYGAPQAADWTWDETAYTATVTLTCPKCEDGTEGHTHDETATVTSTSTATCTQEGTKTYTAKITVSGMEYTNAKSVEDAALGHAYNTTQLVWNWSGYAGATVHVTCTRCDHDEDVAATVTNSVTKEATATENGERTYTATVTVNGQPHTDTKTETILKTGTVPTPGPAYEPLEESGCGSSMTGAASIGGCVTCLALAACLLRRKKTA